MTREDLIDKIAQSLCDSADERTLLQVYYDDNYFKLRLDEHAQWEIRQTAIAMQELINKEKE